MKFPQMVLFPYTAWFLTITYFQQMWNRYSYPGFCFFFKDDFTHIAVSVIRHIVALARSWCSVMVPKIEQIFGFRFLTPDIRGAQTTMWRGQMQQFTHKWTAWFVALFLISYLFYTSVTSEASTKLFKDLCQHKKRDRPTVWHIHNLAHVLISFIPL